MYDHILLNAQILVCMHVVASITHLCKEDVLILMKEVWWLF